ncbi:thioesterase family protein [Fodinicurvata sp. EGI_FJ10296]|uniref:thioesterase family protein n=1 Tax=Fodinicurvata sp. EGI_FJ10296 TaxID=3231908 RepID=UPI0034521674
MRLLRVLVAAFLGRPVRDVMAERQLTFRCWPHDLDGNFHMNNGRFLTLMDLGRLDLVVRAGFTGSMRKNGWMAVIGGAMIRYRRSIAPFERFHLTSRLIGWDDRWFYIRQRFERADGTLIAVALVRGAYRTRDGAVSVPTVMQALGLPAESPALPEAVGHFAASDAVLGDIA